MKNVDNKINTINPPQVITPLYKVNPHKETSPFDKLARTLEQTNSFNDFWESLYLHVNENKNAKLINENLIKNGDYYIQTGFAQEIELLNNRLKYLNENNITICPKVIKMITNENGCSALIYKIPNSKKLIPYKDNENIVPNSNKEKTFKELSKILDMGLVNTDILDNPQNLKISVPENKIVCEDWSGLCSLKIYIENYAPESGRLDFLKNMENTIFNK